MSASDNLFQGFCKIGMLPVVMENAGAKKAALVLLRDNSFTVEIIATIKQNPTFVSLPLETCPEIPTNILNYVKRTLKTVVLDDATVENDFIADAYLSQQQPQSLLCTPILN